MKPSILALAFLASCSTPIAPRSVATTPQPSAASTSTPTVAPPEVAIELAARRARVLDWLRAYREAGVFPSDALGMPASVFVDANGTRCPMAELVYRSGRADLVAAVAREANRVRLADVHEGPLDDWMLGSGLTRDEINMIQGAMNLDFGWIQLDTEVPQILAGQAQVRGKLEIAEIALRDNTASALAAASRQVPTGRTIENLVHTPVLGAVIPPSALAKASAAATTTEFPRRPRFNRFRQ